MKAEYLYYIVYVLCIIILLILLYKYFKDDESLNKDEEIEVIADFRTPLSNNYYRKYNNKYYTIETLNLKKLTVKKLKEEFGEKVMTKEISNMVNKKIILEESDKGKSIKAFLQKRSDINNCKELKLNTITNMFLKLIKTRSFVEKPSEYKIIEESGKSLSENKIDSVEITDERLKIYNNYNKGKVSFNNIFYEKV